MSKKSIYRVVTFWQVALITLGAAAASSGTFVLIGSAFANAGSGTPLAIIIAGFIVMATAASGVSLGVAIPISGGGFIWAEKLGYHWVSFFAGISYLLKGIIEQSVNSLVVVLFAKLFFHTLPVHILAAGILLLVTGVNYIGLKLASETLALLTGLSVLILIIIIIVILPSISMTNLSPFLGTAGLTGLLGGAGSVFFAIGGFERALVMASEIKNPKRTIPYAVAIAYPISIILFLLLCISVIGALGAKTNNNVIAVVDAWRIATSGHWIALPIIATILAACITLGVGVLGASQVAMEMGIKGDLPKWFGVTATVNDTPRNAVLALGLMMTILALLFDLQFLLKIINVVLIVW